ncbi:MAG: hypothetical protein EBX47_07415 [Synechococcaceae bacterium WB8_1B_057]|nr:hypothetical protein [Synechococcaceae bacterium WB6_1A_059]NDG79244.1 hypothetical protein [Synechococcaceae bacterium WB8_1B_057]
MNIEQVETLIDNLVVGPSKWELDNIIYWDRTTNPKTLHDFLTRLQSLSKKSDLNKSELNEKTYLLELLEDLDFDECQVLLEDDEEEIKLRFIENLARTCAIETLTNGRLDIETMNTACKLSPNDFIICAKRTQDLINAIHSLVIKGETLSKDVAGA